ncbi:MAG: exodeoxyribonuclease III [Gammaproteobacteria bacterium]
MFKIATWNLNSLKVRHDHVLDWLASEQPDVLALQETKTQDQNFPLEAINNAGYQVSFAGQKTFNGVATLSKISGQDVVTDLPDFEDPQRRVMGCRIGDVFVLNLYVPNGSEVGSEKYAYKLNWLKALNVYVTHLLEKERHVILLGDFNIAPEDRDVHDPEKWKDGVLVSEPEREALIKIQDEGLVDVFRLFDQEEKSFSWWDYRMLGFQQNNGLRIDLILASQKLSEFCTSCRIDKEPRRLEKPSDHTPVIAEFNL